jgi:AcrR family transcriptional regulator
MTIRETRRGDSGRGIMRARKHTRLPHGSAKDLLLAAAEQLFAEAGVDGVSFRDLVAAAGVNLSSAHYYFDSKHEILAQVFGRSAKIMTERRAELLAAALARNASPPRLDEIIHAFVQPAFEVTRGDPDNAFNRLLARLTVEHSQANHAIVSDAFIENDKLFVEAIALAVPHLDLADIHWRFHLLTGAMIYTMSGSGHLPRLSNNQISLSDTESTLSALVDSFVAAFRAPATKPRAATRGE